MAELTYTIAEVGRLLGISKNGVYLAAKTNQLPVPVIKIGKRLMVGRAVLDRFLADGGIQQPSPPANGEQYDMRRSVQLAPRLYAEIVTLAKAQDKPIPQVVERLIERALLLDRMLST